MPRPQPWMGSRGEEEEGGRELRAFGVLGGFAEGAERGGEGELPSLQLVCGERGPPEEIGRAHV